MSDDNRNSTIELNRRRVLAGLGTIGVASAGAGAGTMALFSDEETNSGNTIQAGTLDLTTEQAQTFTGQAQNLAPGEKTNKLKITLGNAGSIAGDHVELAVGYDQNDGTEPADNGLSSNVTARQFADRLFVSELAYPNSNASLGLGVDAFNSFLNHQDGATVIDISEKGTSDIELARVDDPASGRRTDVVQASSGGTATNDYAISMRNIPDINLSDIGSGDITFDYYGGAYNTESAPDEVWVVVDDPNGDKRLFYHAGNDGAPDAQTWKTRDVGAEISGDGSALNAGFNWFEAAPGDMTASAPDNGGLAKDVSGKVEAVGFGRGTTSGGDTIEVYYDNLVVNGQSYKFRPISLDDISRRGMFDNLDGLAAGDAKNFRAQFELDRRAGNEFQGDGVDISFNFGLAQESGQDVL